MKFVNKINFLLKLFKKNKEAYKLAENFLSLSVLNIVNYLFPILLIPYLTRVLGVEKYGLYSFGFSIINYFVLIVSYGFDFSATRQVAILRDDKIKLTRLFSSVLTVRLILSLFSLIILLLLIFIFSQLWEERILLLSGYGIILGTAFLPIWFFQGMENMKVITLTNFFIKLGSTSLIFIYVKSKNDYSIALLFQSVGYILGGIISILFAIFHFKVRLVIPQIEELKNQFKEGLHVFVSTIGMNFYRESNTIILGVLTNFTNVGYYAASEKLIKVIQSLTSPFVNSIFPFFSRKLNIHESNISNLKLYKKIAKYYSILLSVITIVVILLAPYVIKKYLDADFSNSILNVQILSIIVLLGGMNYYYGIIGMINFGQGREFARAVWIAGLSSIVVCCLFSKTLLDKAAVLAMVFAELLLFIQIYLIFIKSNKRNEI